MKAKDTLYHEEGCFVCAECSLDLREVAVYAKDAALYCEKHYKEKFVPKCARCLDYITEVSQHHFIKLEEVLGGIVSLPINGTRS